jgi:hypothetical protein
MTQKIKLSGERKISILAGTLYIIGLASGVLSVSAVADGPDYLTKAYGSSNQVLVSALSQFIMTFAYAGYGLALYSILKKYKEGLALGFLSFRLMAAVLNIVGFLSLLMILSLSRQYVTSGAANTDLLLILGELLRSGRDYVNHVAMIITTSLAGLLLYIILYQTGLVPRWISVWGLAGTLITILASLLVMFHKIDILTKIYFLLNLPLILIELFLAIWLIIKGFKIDITG